MRLAIFLGLLTAATAQVLPAVASDIQPATLSGEWKPLLDSSLSQWEIFIGVPHKSVNIPGVPATQSEDGIHGGKPLGLNNDPLKVFTVIEEEGKPVLHVSGQIFGCVSTKATFENYHLRWQFRWGTKKWPPRETQRRDSGVLIHCFDPHGAFWNCWRNCLECQVMENDCGDFFPLGSTADSTVRPQIAGARAIFDPKGIFCSGAGPVSHGPSVEKPEGEWNIMEVYTVGQTSVFVVNGTVNNVLFNAKRPTPDYSAIEPLTSGYIQIQSEGAEVFYRDIVIQGITEFPPELKEITKLPTTPPVKYAPIGQETNEESEIDLSKFKLTFDDEFDGNQLDTNKWQAPEMPRQGSSRCVKSLVSVHDGALHLGVRLTKDPMYRYDCGAVRTEPDYDPSRAMFRQRYGYFEACAKLPKNLKADYWAAFWLMCGNAYYGSSDTRQAIEADIMESFHLAKATNCPLTFHWNGYNKKHNQAEIESATTPQLWNGEFHRYGMYWDEHCYVAFLDGKEIARTDLMGLGTTNGGKTLSQGPCQQPGYVKLTCEAAAWVGASKDWEKEMAAEDEFVVDYVRVYEGTLPAKPKSNPATATKNETAAIQRKTAISIVSDDFYINGKLTYEGRSWNGHRIEGLLMNSRMVQATYDDLNSDTAKKWSYADTGKWDAERNVNEFIAAMPEWKKHGLLAVTVNFQGGSPEGYSKSQPWITSAFNEDGTLRPEFTARLKRVLDAADANGMVVILGYFYFGQDQNLRDEAAVIRATDEATRWLLDGGWKNVVVELNNETNPGYHHEILRPTRVHELIERVRQTERDGRRLLVGTSYGGGFVPQENVVRASDFLLLHGNGVTNSARITKMIQETRSVSGYRPKPILFNEDDHENFNQPANNCAAAVAEHVSWGWFDFRRPGEASEQGYQSPPVNWGISSPRKQAFFNYLGEITGYESLHSCSQWQTIQPTNACTARHETCMVALKGKLYLLGGRGDKPVEEYNPKANTWRQLAKPPIEINHFQAVVVGERIAAVGAFTGVFPHEQPVPNIWFFDPSKNEWSKGPEIPEARRRGSAGVVVVGDLVYVVGGITEGHWQGFVPWLDNWNIKTGKWEILPDAPRPRDHFQAAVLDGKIIAAGGRTTHGAIGKVFELTIPEVDAFDIAKGTWETLPQPLPTPRAGAMVVARGDTLVVAGGESATQNKAHAQVEAFNIKRGDWISLPDLQQGRHSCGLSQIGNTLYAVAGAGNSGGAPELNSMEKLDWNAAMTAKKSERKIDLSKFKLTFDDEFNGDRLDTNKWEAPEMPRQGSCRWVKSLVNVHDGALHLGIRLTQDPVLRYDCGAVRTERNYDPSQAMFQQRYGYFETRAKLPKNLKADYWAAFWLMCSQVRYDSISDTREAIEMDILESFPLWYKTNLSMTFHWNGYGKKHNIAGIELAPTPELRDGEFHRYGMYWDEHCYVAFYDGREVGRTDLIGFGKKDAGMTPSQGPCQKPCYVKLSCEAAAWAGGDGTHWEKEMTAEDEFVVDYVRVYQGTLPALP